MPKRKSKERGVGRPAWRRALRREIASAEKIVVLGIGHPDQGDDAAGILSARDLKKRLGRRARSRVKVLLGYETPENLTGEIRKFSPCLVIMIDAAIGLHPPGTVFPVAPEDIPDDGISTHKISLRMLVTYLESTVGCRVRFLGVQPGRIELGRALTPAAERATRMLAHWLGKALEKKSGS